MRGKIPPVSHVIFDFGGTIIDLSYMYQVCLDIAQMYDRNLPESMISIVKNFKTFDEMIDTFITLADLGKIRIEIKQLYKAMTIERIEKEGVPMVCGVKKLIKHLSEHNIPMAIATHGDRNMTKFTMDNTIGFNPSDFTHIITGYDPEVKNNKPAPDIYLVCGKRFSSPPNSLQNCVIFEDSILGITGAVNTGMKSVLINEGKAEIPDSIVDKITVIVDSFNSFKPESVGLPPYQH